MASKPENQPSKAALEDETHSTLEREFWKKVTYNPHVLRGRRRHALRRQQLGLGRV